VWPKYYEGNCTNDPRPCDNCLPWQTCINDECAPQCLEDKHCPEGYRCDCKWCVPLDTCDSTDSKCPGFDAVCHIPAHENCFWCDVDSCKEGCVDNTNCPPTHPICGHGKDGAHRCGCNADSDCTKPGEICDTEDQDGDGDRNECVEDLNCRNTDSMCPGFDVTCEIDPLNNQHSMCEWCNGKKCDPGCANDSVCPHTYPICGHGGAEHRCGCTSDDDCANVPGVYKCNITTHQCKAEQGQEILDSIKIYSTSCSGCSSEGVQITLLGKKQGNYLDGIPCTTHTLDHIGTIDFAAGNTVFDGRKNGKEDSEEIKMMGECYQAGLNGDITGGNVTWMGTGTWSSNGQICLDWKNDQEWVDICNLTGAGPVWTLTGCEKKPVVFECP